MKSDPCPFNTYAFLCQVSYPGIKEKLLAACRTELQQKISLLQNELDELRESLTSETKSSVGDKHETSRARMQADFEKFSFQLAEVQKQYSELQRIDPRRSSEVVAPDSLVVTSQRNFFLAVPIGKIEMDARQYHVISKDSPIALQLLGKKKDDVLNFNGVEYRIQEIQ